jgi:hypothetical protein
MKSETSNDLICGATNTVVIAAECGHGLRIDSEPTKHCNKCGRDLPLSAYTKKSSSADGLQDYCKECRSEYARIYNQKKRAERLENESSKLEKKEVVIVERENPMTKVYSDPELARFTPRQLMQELKARGWTWDWMLEPQRKVYFNKI